MSARTIIEAVARFYDPRSLWLHGTSAEFTQFKLGGKSGWDAGGIFLVKDTPAQEAYARSYGAKLYRCRVQLSPDQVFELPIPEHVERVLAVETEDAIGSDFMRSAESGQRYGHVDWATLDQEVLELAGFKGCILAERPKGFNGYSEDILSLCVFDPSVIEIVGRVERDAQDVIESADRPYGYWIDRSGNLTPVVDWGLHGEVASNLLASLGEEVGADMASATLQRRGYLRVAGVHGLGHEGENTIYADSYPLTTWERLPRAQRRSLEDLANRTGKPLVLNTTNVDLPRFVIESAQGVVAGKIFYHGAKKVIESELPDVLYHVTYANRLDDIMVDGLQPNMPRSIGAPSYDGHARGRVFLSDARGVSLWAQRAEEFAMHNSDDPREENLVPVVLRVKVPQEMQDDDEGTRDSGGRAWFVTEPISPENIEVWDGSRWSDQVPDAVLAAAFDEEGYFVRNLPTVPKL